MHSLTPPALKEQLRNEALWLQDQVRLHILQEIGDAVDSQRRGLEFHIAGQGQIGHDIQQSLGATG